MVQWDKDSCADAGFLKIDLLGLGMLSAVERCVEEVERVRGERIDLSRIPFDDPRTFRAIRAADTVGVFQIESRAQMQSLLRTRPMNLEDLTIQVAIVRPGPIQGGAVNPYIARRQRLREDPAYEVPFEHPALEPVLRETLGTIIFQDQVMQVAEAFAGFGPGEADGLRRAMSRKRSHERLLRHRERFVQGAMRPRRRRPRRRRAGVEDGRGLRRVRLPQVPQRRLRAARLPVHVAAGPLRPGVPVRAAQRAADGLLRPRQPRPRGPAEGHRAAGGGRQRLGGAVHGAGGRRAAGPALRQGRPRGRAGRARRRAPARRALRRPRRAGRPLGGQAHDARAARLVGRLRQPGRGRPAAHGAVAAGDRGPRPGPPPMPRPGRRQTQLALPLELPRRPPCARWGAGSG